MACGILAIGDMTAATIDKTAAALGGALGNFASSRIAASAPLSEPLTISRAYATRCVFCFVCCNQSVCACVCVRGGKGLLRCA
jgi:hypothetical protein